VRVHLFIAAPVSRCQRHAPATFPVRVGARGVDQPHTKQRLRRRVSAPVNGLALHGDGYEGGIVRLSSAPSAAEVNDSRAINSIVGQF
jgi:hypothetical protein